MRTVKNKYIVGELPSGAGSTMGAIVFPPFVNHADVAKLFLPNEITSAGFFTVYEGRVYPEGESTSLGLTSRAEDARLIARVLGLPLE